MFTRNKIDPEIDGVVHRVCDLCNILKPLDDNFFLCSDRKSRRHKCKACVGEERRARPRTAEQKRASRIKKIYGLTVGQFDEMWESQGGRCAICSVELSVEKANSITNVNIDHCHVDNTVRGLLCSRCNRGLGQFLDDEEILRNAIDYLRRARGNFVQDDSRVQTLWTGESDL